MERERGVVAWMVWIPLLPLTDLINLVALDIALVIVITVTVTVTVTARRMLRGLASFEMRALLLVLLLVLVHVQGKMSRSLEVASGSQVEEQLDAFRVAWGAAFCCCN